MCTCVNACVGHVDAVRRLRGRGPRAAAGEAKRLWQWQWGVAVVVNRRPAARKAAAARRRAAPRRRRGEGGTSSNKEEAAEEDVEENEENAEEIALDAVFSVVAAAAAAAACARLVSFCLRVCPPCFLSSPVEWAGSLDCGLVSIHYKLHS